VTYASYCPCQLQNTQQTGESPPSGDVATLVSQARQDAEKRSQETDYKFSGENECYSRQNQVISEFKLMRMRDSLKGQDK
jgi:hypothetical protein